MAFYAPIKRSWLKTGDQKRASMIMGDLNRDPDDPGDQKGVLDENGDQISKGPWMIIGTKQEAMDETGKQNRGPE